MKKIVGIIVLICVVIIGIGYYLYSNNDNLRFKLSYEMSNNDTYSNGKTIKVHIPINNNVKYLNAKELDDFLDDGSGLLYFGYSECPWCRNVVPVLVDVAKNKKIKINYVDTHKVDLSKTTAYTKLYDYLREDETGKKVFAYPAVYMLDNGQVLDFHIGAVDSYKNPYNKMLEKEIVELKEIYEDLIEGGN